MKINWRNSIYAGITGTLLFDIVGFSITSQWWEIPGLLGPKWIRALSFVTVQTVMGVWLFMLPLLGAGIAGLEMNPWMPLITLTRHFAYAIPLIFIISVSISPKETKPLRVLESQTV